MTTSIRIAVCLVFACSKAPPAETPSSDPVPEPRAEQPPAIDAGPPPIIRGTTLELELSKPIDLGSGGRAELRDYTVEEIAESPEDPQAYPAGSGVTMSVVILGEVANFSDLSEPYDSRKIAWTSDFRLRLASHDPGKPSVTIEVHKIGDSAEASLVSSKRVQREGELEIEPGLALRFRGNSHKSVYAGQESPLIVSVEYVEGSAVHAESYNLESDSLSWRWRNYAFAITAHEYDRWMELSVDKLTLAPL